VICVTNLYKFSSQTLKGSGWPNAANVEGKPLQQEAHTIT